MLYATSACSLVRWLFVPALSLSYLCDTVGGHTASTPVKAKIAEITADRIQSWKKAALN